MPGNVTVNSIELLLTGSRNCHRDRDEIALSLERMNGIEGLDTTNRTITVQAGAALQKVQETAEDADLLFPLDLGARGTHVVNLDLGRGDDTHTVIAFRAGLSILAR